MAARITVGSARRYHGNTSTNVTQGFRSMYINHANEHDFPCKQVAS